MNQPSILDTAKFRHLVLDQVGSMVSEINNLQGFQIPAYDKIEIAYYGTTNNPQTVVYKSAGVVVATLTITYSTQPPVSNDAKIAAVTLS
jgi:hypothetical protein